MNIGAEFCNLKRDLKSCQDMVTDAAKKRESCRAVHSVCDCSSKRTGELKAACKMPTSQSGGARGKGYHRHCVPKAPKPVPKKSPQRRTGHFERREHFETESARVDVEIQSSKPLNRADVKCYPEEKTQPPRVKSSWGNILKEQNQGEATRHVSYDPRILRMSSCDENWDRPSSRHTKDSAVQCSSPPSREVPAKSVFSSYDPIRTLQFLMDEFRAKAKMKCEPEMGDIISDMDCAIQRLCHDCISGVSQGGAVSWSKDAVSNYNRLLPAAPSFESVPPKSTKDEVSPRAKSQTATSSSSNFRRLEESYQALVKTCQAAEVRCTRLVEERERQLRELGEKNLIIEQCTRKEREYEVKLAESVHNLKTMEAKNLQYTKSLTDLTQMLTKLQEENKVVGSLREMQGKLKVKLQEVTQENHKLLTENQLMVLEREKNKMLLQIKDQEINKLKNDIQKISSMVNEELKSRVKSLKLSSSSTFDLSGSDLDSSIAPSSSCRIDNKKSRGHSDNLVSSSPNSSASSSPLPYMSWQRVSKIPSEPVLSVVDGQARRAQEGERDAKGKSPTVNREDGGGRGGVECIEALKEQLHGFVENMKEQLQLGGRHVGGTVGASVVCRPDQRSSAPVESSPSLSSMAMSEFSDAGPPAPNCDPNDNSYVDLSRYKKHSSNW